MQLNSLTQQIAELAVFGYGAVALGRGLLIDLDKEPGRYAGISWFDRKLNLFLLAAMGMLYGGFFLASSLFGFFTTNQNYAYLFFRALKILIALVLIDAGLYFYDRYLKRNTQPTHGGSAEAFRSDEPPQTRMPHWIRVFSVIAILLINNFL
jgi:hypothetical protein